MVGGARRRQCRGVEPLVPGQGGGEPARGHAIASPIARRGRRCSAGCSANIASSATRRSRTARARASFSPTTRSGSTKRWRSPKRPFWSAISSTRLPAISARPSCRLRPRRRASEFGAKLTVTTGKALDEGYPMIAAVGRAAAQGPRAAPDRAGHGATSATRASPSSARASASIRAGSTSSLPPACG